MRVSAEDLGTTVSNEVKDRRRTALSAFMKEPNLKRKSWEQTQRNANKICLEGFAEEPELCQKTR